MEKTTYIVYVLFSPTAHKIYVGDTSNIDQRLYAHNHASNKGWTKSFRPWKLIHKETFQTKQKALKREKQLKSAKGREYIWNSGPRFRLVPWAHIRRSADTGSSPVPATKTR